MVERGGKEAGSSRVAKIEGSLGVLQMLHDFRRFLFARFWISVAFFLDDD